MILLLLPASRRVKAESLHTPARPAAVTLVTPIHQHQIMYLLLSPSLINPSTSKEAALTCPPFCVQISNNKVNALDTERIKTLLGQVGQGSCL